jgi:hypothetical protein
MPRAVMSNLKMGSLGRQHSILGFLDLESFILPLTLPYPLN